MNGTANSGVTGPGGINGSPGAINGEMAQGGTYDDALGPGGGGGSAKDVTGSYLGGVKVLPFCISPGDHSNLFFLILKLYLFNLHLQQVVANYFRHAHQNYTCSNALRICIAEVVNAIMIHEKLSVQIVIRPAGSGYGTGGFGAGGGAAYLAGGGGGGFRCF